MNRITLPKKLTPLTDWLELNKEQKIKVDYPTREQSQRLQDILLHTELGNSRMATFSQYLIKFTVKAWEGFDEELKLINNEIENELWWRFVKDVESAMELGTLIREKVDFTISDKKKLN